MNDPVADMLTRVRNANLALIPDVEVSHSKMKESIAHILKREGYIAEVSIEGQTVAKKLKLKLKYNGRKGVIAGLRRVSKPGLRVYSKADKIPRVLGGLGVAVLSTSRGLLTDREARKQGVGGEILCYVW